MRTIKFRGRYPEESEFKGEWRYGNGANPEEGLIIDTSNEPAQINNSQTFHVDKNTIGQCIGLNDRNGREIYEGDIVKWYNSILNRYIIAKIVWDNLDCSFSAKNKNNLSYHIPRFTKIEVIGNIYDTPELIYKEE